MSDFLEEYGLEMESDHFSAPMGRPTPPDPMLQPRKKGGALGKVLCLVLGFVLGVGGTVGGVAGAGYMVATQRIKDTIGTIGGLVGTEIKYQDFITEKYAEQTIMGAIGEISKVAQKFSTGDGCLNDLNDISPLVSTSIDPLLQTLTDFGMDINKEDLMALPFSQFPDFFMEAIKEIELIAILNAANVTDESPILNAICYDLDGNPTKLGIFFDEGPEGLLNNIPADVCRMLGADYVITVDVNPTRYVGTDELGSIAVIKASFSIMMANSSYKGYLNSDVMIKVDTDKFKSYSKNGFDEMYALGYEAGKQAIPEILEKIYF